MSNHCKWYLLLLIKIYAPLFQVVIVITSRKISLRTIRDIVFILKFKLAADSRGEHTLRNCPMQDLLAYHNAS